MSQTRTDNQNDSTLQRIRLTTQVKLRHLCNLDDRLAPAELDYVLSKELVARGIDPETLEPLKASAATN